MALHEKLPALDTLEADIAILPECANRDILGIRAADFRYTSAEWIGRHRHKGLGVFSFGPWSIERYPGYDDSIEFALPLIVTGPENFHVLAIWAFHPKKRGPRAQYLGPTREAVARYRDFLGSAPSIVAGDFNNSVIWDKPGTACNHAEAIADLDRIGLHSAYHMHTGAAAGREPDPTLFWTRNAEKLYHIDYCFIPRSWTARVKGVTVGSAAEWMPISDHAPLTVDIAPD